MKLLLASLVLMISAQALALEASVVAEGAINIPMAVEVQKAKVFCFTFGSGDSFNSDYYYPEAIFNKRGEKYTEGPFADELKYQFVLADENLRGKPCHELVESGLLREDILFGSLAEAKVAAENGGLAAKGAEIDVIFYTNMDPMIIAKRNELGKIQTQRSAGEDVAYPEGVNEVVEDKTNQKAE